MSARLRRLIPRFSLRTLVVFLLLVTSGMGLWWYSRAWTTVAELRKHDGPVRCARFSHDGSRIATAGDDSTARVWDARSGKCILILRGHSGALRCSAWDPGDARVAAGGDDGTVRIWSADDGKLLFLLKGHGSPVEGMEFDYLHTLFTEDGKEQRKWKLPDGTSKVVRLRPIDSPYMLVLRPAGQYIGSDGRVMLPDDHGWHVMSGSEGKALMADHSAYGRAVVVACDDGVTRVLRRRLERWWGIFWLWEFWLTAALAGLFVWSVVRDRRSLRAKPEPTP